MTEREILDATAGEVARIRYNAYLLHDSNVRLAMEIDLRMTELLNIINSRRAQLAQVTLCPEAKNHSIIERAFATLRTFPKVDYSLSKAPDAHPVSVTSGSDLLTFSRHSESLN